MSYIAIVTTKKPINSFMPKYVIVKSIEILFEKPISLNKGEFGYLVGYKDEFCPFYYPSNKIKFNDKETYLKLIDKINREYLITGCFFTDLGTDINCKNSKITMSFAEFVNSVELDDIKDNVFYKIRHDYQEYLNH